MKLAVPALALALAATLPAHAQMVADVKFPAGTYGTTVNGAVAGQEYFDYQIGAKGGQTLYAVLRVDATNGDGNAYFNILPPGSSGEAIFIGSMAPDNTAAVKLPADGTYTIRVYLMGNDADTGKTVGYSLDITVN